MIAKLAYLTTPQAGAYVLNIQPEGSDDLLRFEISKAHLANILISGTAIALREDQYHRIPPTPTESVDHERAGA
jgi:hypothetical protein